MSKFRIHFHLRQYRSYWHRWRFDIITVNWLLSFYVPQSSIGVSFFYHVICTHSIFEGFGDTGPEWFRCSIKPRKSASFVDSRRFKVLLVEIHSQHGDSVSQWKSEKFDPHSPKTPEPIVTKICMRDYFGDPYPYAKFITIQLPIFVPQICEMRIKWLG